MTENTEIIPSEPKPKLDDFNLICYKAICGFIQDLNEVFGTKIHQIALYTRLIEKTSITQTKPILKHITIFRDFCQNNREAILNKDPSKFWEKNIIYSGKVYLNIRKIFEICKEDSSTQEAIWKHLLTISALLDPASKAKSVLKECSKKGKEEEFLSKIIESAEKNINPDADPAEAVKGMMNSGMFTEMMGNLTEGMKTGELDITKLIGLSQSLMNTLTTEMTKEGVQPVAGVDFSALSGLTSMLPALMSGMSGGGMSGPPLDISALTSSLSQTGNKLPSPN